VNKKNWLLAVSPVLIVWGLDQLSKMWAVEFTRSGPTWYKWGGIVMHHNSGAMLGMFSDLPPLLRVVSLATSGAFLVFVYAIIQFFLPENVMKLRVGLSILLGGILGNVTDRILYGSIIDFLVFGRGTNLSPAFNVADGLQWVGYGLIVYMILFKSHLIWHEDNKRNKLWIDPAYQLKYSVILASVSIWFSIVFGVYTYTFMKVMINDLIVNGTTNGERYLFPFLAVLLILSLTFSFSLFLIGRHLSHRSVGPIFGFKRYVADLREGVWYTFKLRQSDEFKDLEGIAETLRADLMELDQLRKEKEDALDQVIIDKEAI
jgi:signal peptidase II